MTHPIDSDAPRSFGEPTIRLKRNRKGPTRYYQTVDHPPYDVGAIEREGGQYVVKAAPFPYTVGRRPQNDNVTSIRRSKLPELRFESLRAAEHYLLAIAIDLHEQLLRDAVNPTGRFVASIFKKDDPAREKKPNDQDD